MGRLFLCCDRQALHVEMIGRMKASQRAQSISPFFAMEIGKQAAALEAQGHRVIKLNIGEPDFGAPPGSSARCAT